MITREQALDTAHRWINGELPQDSSVPVRSHEFELGWVVWPEPAPVQINPLTGVRRVPEEIGAACAVVDRVSGELSVWPSVPVPEVVRLYRDRVGAGTYDPLLPPAIGPGARAVLTFLDAQGEKQTLTVDSAPGLPHPALRAWQQLSSDGVQPEDVLALHTDLRLAMLPGSYAAEAVHAASPEVPFTFDVAYGPHFDHRAAAIRAVSAARARTDVPPLNRMPFPTAVPPAQPESHEQLTARFGADRLRRFDAAAIADLPDAAARLLRGVGLPRKVDGFFTVHHPESDGIIDGTPTGDVLPELTTLGPFERATAAARAALPGRLLLGTDGWSYITIDTADGHIHATDPETATARYCNADLTAFLRSLALLADRHPRLRDLTPHSAGPAVSELQWALAALDPTVFSDPENWWSVIVEQLWHGLL